MVVAWTLSNNPSDNYLECNGQSVDRNKYPKLYALMHNTPDYRGVFLRGLGGNSAALGMLQSDAIRNITGTVHGAVEESQSYATGAFSLITSTTDGADHGKQSWGFSFDASRVVPVANENRPINKAVRYFIKAK